MKNLTFGTIYKVSCVENNKIYVGQTVQKLSKRWSAHLKDSKTKQNIKFNRAINKYGPEKFVMEIIEECNIENMNDREVFWINYYNSIENGYNTTIGGFGGSSPSPVDLYYEDGTYVESFKLMSLGGKKYNVGVNGICACVSGKQKSAGRFDGKRLVWVKRGEKFPNIDYNNVFKNTKIKVIGYNEDINMVFDGVREATRYFGISSSTMISDCISGKRHRKSAGKYNGKPIYWKKYA